jgi:6-phosphofructokinase 1
VELFGRNSGETSLITALLAQVDRALISEVPFEIEKVADLLMDDKRRNPSNYAVLTVSEGATYKGGKIIESGKPDAFGHKKLGGIANNISDDIKRLTGTNTMIQPLTYVIRSGPPDSLDRMVGLAYGSIAMDLIKNDDTGKLAALKDGKYTSVPLESVISGKKYADVDSYYDKENYKPFVKVFQNHPMFLT